MRIRKSGRGPFALLAVLVLVACGRATPEPELAPPTEAARGAETAEVAERDTLQDADRAERARLEALYRARVDSARMRFTGSDLQFMQGMIVHHGQALVMANLAPERDASPALRRMAERIRISQEDEIALMQRWLRDRGQAVPELEVEGTTLTVHGIDKRALHMEGRHGHTPAAHGMLTQAELDELGEARGSEFDRLFLTNMIRHHRGAVTMVRELFATPGAARDPEMFRLASDIQADQLTEIARMEQMLERMSGPEPGR